MARSGLFDNADGTALDDRTDWHPWRGRFIVRISASRRHQFMVAHVERVILTSFADIIADSATPPALVDLLRQVQPMRSSNVPLGPGRSSPDASYGHFQARVPSVVVEVFYPQKTKDLKGLARDYIGESVGNVQVVIGIDIEYRRTKMGVVSVWRAERRYDPNGRLRLAARRVVADQVSFLFPLPVFPLLNTLTRRGTTRSRTGMKPAPSCQVSSPSTSLTSCPTDWPSTPSVLTETL